MSAQMLGDLSLQLPVLRANWQNLKHALLASNPHILIPITVHMVRSERDIRGRLDIEVDADGVAKDLVAARDVIASAFHIYAIARVAANTILTQQIASCVAVEGDAVFAIVAHGVV